MKRYLFFILSAIVICNSLFSQTPEDFPVLNKTDLPGATFSPPRSFNGESLYGYIDGGADLYLEYGFIAVVATEFVYQKHKYKTDIYKMKDPMAAFGIFSVSRFRCKSRPDIASYTCMNKYQLQISVGQYYISIVNESGTVADSTASLLIGRKIIGKINESSADIARFLPGIPAETVINESHLVKGRLGIINGVPDLENYLKGLDNFTAVILEIPGKTMVSIKFDNREGLENFALKHNLEADKISDTSTQAAGGEFIKRLYDNHLLIEIPAIK